VSDIKRVRAVTLPLHSDKYPKKILIIDYKNSDIAVFIGAEMIKDAFEEWSVIYYTPEMCGLSTEDKYKYINLDHLIAINPEKWRPIKTILFE
jgi:hypothetical protein